MVHAIATRFALVWAVVLSAASVCAADDDNALSGQFDFGGDATSGDLTLTGEFRIDQETREGQLSVKAKATPGWHTYSLTQKGGPGPSRLIIEKPIEVETIGPFKADRDPHPSKAKFPDGKPVWDVPVEEFEEVVWTAPITLAEAVDPQKLTIQARFDGQVCSDTGGCIPLSDKKITIKFAGFLGDDWSQTEYTHRRIHAKLTGYAEPKVAAPGDKVKLTITAEPAADWHIYPYADKLSDEIVKKYGGQPTLIVPKLTNGWQASAPIADGTLIEKKPKSKDERSSAYYESPVSWTIEYQVPTDAAADSYELTGVIGYQTCDVRGRCDPPHAAQFRVSIPVESNRVDGKQPVGFQEFDNYKKIAEELESTSSPVVQSSLTGTSLWLILLIALAAGLILNVMPCVLPVIGLKIMSFVQQAGESRVRIFSLNAWFALGLMSVFWVIATVAVILSLLNRTLSWGAQFSDPAFLIPLIGIVVVFGLSFLGVWEIPIPGFVGSGGSGKPAEREGAGGAFAKGVLATVLATPCTGPLFGPAVSWAVVQPWWLIYVAFTALGLGMALPYLLIGAFPKLINMLPRPGAWMETFKKVMGFVLLGTAVWLFYTMRQADALALSQGGGGLFGGYVVETLTLVMVLAFACWIIGRTPLTAEFGQKLRAWTQAIILVTLVSLTLFASGKWVFPTITIIAAAALAGWLITSTPFSASMWRKMAGWGTAVLVLLAATGVLYLSLLSADLPWEPFSRAKLDEYRNKGYTVLIDFTADS